jgi:hypothetical protein
MTATKDLATQVYQVFIKASPEQVWEAITKPGYTARYFHGARIENTPERGRGCRAESVSGPLSPRSHCLDGNGRRHDKQHYQEILKAMSSFGGIPARRDHHGKGAAAASLYSGRSSRCIFAAARMSCGDSGEVLMRAG